MTRTRIRTAFIAALVGLLGAATGYGLYSERSAAQRHRPESAPPQQAAQPRSTPPPQAAQPRQSTPPPRSAPPKDNAQGRTRPPDAPAVGRAEPRQGPPARPGYPGHGGGVYYPGPWIGWYGFPWYGYPWAYPAPAVIAAEWATSSIRLEVTPKTASVYVDRYYAGTVDDFDGFFQSLQVPTGSHLIEIRKEGYHTLVVEVNLQPGQTIHYKRVMEPAGEAIEPAAPPAPVDEAAGDQEQFLQVPGYVRFDVKPKDAEVYADGYYAGLVDDFDGTQLLILTPGTHHIELRARGYESVQFDVDVRPKATIDYRRSLEPK